MLKLSAKLLHFFETNKKKSKNLQLEQGKGLLFPTAIPIYIIHPSEERVGAFGKTFVYFVYAQQILL